MSGPGLVMGETTRLCTQGPRAGQVRSNDMSGWQTEMKRRARGVVRKTMVQSNHFPLTAVRAGEVMESREAEAVSRDGELWLR